jgi:hypothetical protein
LLGEPDALQARSACGVHRRRSRCLRLRR